MEKMVENVIHLLVHVAAAYGAYFIVYLIFRPSGAGGVLWFFLFVAVIAVPTAIWVTDIARGFTKQVVVIRVLVALISGVIYVVLITSHTFSNLGLSSLEYGPLVAATVSELVLHNRQKDS